MNSLDGGGSPVAEKVFLQGESQTYSCMQG